LTWRPTKSLFPAPVSDHAADAGSLSTSKPGREQRRRPFFIQARLRVSRFASASSVARARVFRSGSPFVFSPQGHLEADLHARDTVYTNAHPQNVLTRKGQMRLVDMKWSRSGYTSGPRAFALSTLIPWPNAYPPGSAGQASPARHLPLQSQQLAIFGLFAARGRPASNIATGLPSTNSAAFSRRRRVRWETGCPDSWPMACQHPLAHRIAGRASRFKTIVRIAQRFEATKRALGVHSVKDIAKALPSVADQLRWDMRKICQKKISCVVVHHGRDRPGIVPAHCRAHAARMSTRKTEQPVVVVVHRIQRSRCMWPKSFLRGACARR